MKKGLYAMIPARYGSERLKLKNLALLDGKPLIYYAIKSAKLSNMFEKIYINSDNLLFKKIAKRYKVDFYLRPKHLGSSETRSDEVVEDFMKFNPQAKNVAWINSIDPFQTKDNIKHILKYYFSKNLDSLITTEKKQVHGMYANKPINFKKNKLFEKTQNLKEIELFTYSLMIWKSKTFLKEFKKNGNAFFCGKFSTFEIKKNYGVIIKNINDIKFANLIIKFKKNFKLKYDKISKIK
tara:strand:- start:182 stop:895 length:714 start_codon:yes stop_codon:yes gene_type:complete